MHYDAAVVAVRDVLGQTGFDSAWAEGAALSSEEVIAYAQRGRGERKRPAAGRESLTPPERVVVRLVGQRLANKGIALRLVISPGTVQTHLATSIPNSDSPHAYNSSKKRPRHVS